MKPTILHLPLHLICTSNGSQYDSIFCQGSYLYACNGYQLIRARTRLFTQLSDEDIKRMDGRFIHRAAYEALYQSKGFVVSDAGFIVREFFI